jgi:DNA mismatch endonuclease (patch repair protein)
MADIWTPRRRSAIMARIRSTGNKSTELRLVAILRSEGITGWRRNQPVFGRPDFVFKAARVAVFVDGCFWHACPRCFRRPQSNNGYWDDKFQRNQRRDREVNRELRRLGWRVLRIWAHELVFGAETTVAIRIRRAVAKRGPFTWYVPGFATAKRWRGTTTSESLTNILPRLRT